MPNNLENKVVIAISSRALFKLEDSNLVFDEEKQGDGVVAFGQKMIFC